MRRYGSYGHYGRYRHYGRCFVLRGGQGFRSRYQNRFIRSAPAVTDQPDMYPSLRTLREFRTLQTLQELRTLWTAVRRQSVDSLNGGFFTRSFCAVGRSVKKKKSRYQYRDTILYVRMIRPDQISLEILNKT